MNYNYTAYYKDNNERIKAIAEDILSEYPNLGSLAEEAAKMEKPFGRVHEDYDAFSNQANHVNRLIDIVIVTEGKEEYKQEYEKACRNLLDYYYSWKENFTYGNPKEQSVYIVMQRYFEHLDDPNKPLITIKDADKIRRFQLEAEERQRKWKIDHTMQYNYTAYFKNDEERIKAIADDILREYPNLGFLAEVAARMETPFGRVHEDYDAFSDQENHINRLIDIIIVTEGKPKYQNEYEKACRDIMKNYSSWQQAFTYANPEEQAVYLLMEQFQKHLKDQNSQLFTYREARDEQRQRMVKKEMQRKADMLRSQYPKLGDLADEVIRLEEESGVWLRFQENDLIRLVYIIKLSEDKEEYSELYSESIAQLNEMYQTWLKYETHYMSDEKQMIIEMMNRLNEHLQNRNVPISTFPEIKQEFESKKEYNL